MEFTTRERIALRLTTEELTSKEIGVSLGLPWTVVKALVASAMFKLRAATLTDAVTVATRRGLLLRR